MKNIMDQKVRINLKKRIIDLHYHSPALWGRMDVNQMICHVSDQIRMATGSRKTDYIGNRLQTSVLKYLVLLGMPTPKGRVPTVKELNQEKLGTPPTQFNRDREILLDLIHRFAENYPDGGHIIHPAFGAMNKSQWARLIYLHLNHHLKQFGV